MSRHELSALFKDYLWYDRRKGWAKGRGVIISNTRDRAHKCLTKALVCNNAIDLSECESEPFDVGLVRRCFIHLCYDRRYRFAAHRHSHECSKTHLNARIVGECFGRNALENRDDGENLHWMYCSVFGMSCEKKAVLIIDELT